MVPPAGTVVRGVITSTGLTAAPATPPEAVMEVNVIPVITPVSKRADAPASALVLIWKPPVTAARTLPRVSPVRVIPNEEVPVAEPAAPVVRTIVVLVAVAAGDEVAVKPATVAAVMEATDPKK